MNLIFFSSSQTCFFSSVYPFAVEMFCGNPPKERISTLPSTMVRYTGKNGNLPTHINFLLFELF